MLRLALAKDVPPAGAARARSWASDGRRGHCRPTEYRCVVECVRFG